VTKRNGSDVPRKGTGPVTDEESAHERSDMDRRAALRAFVGLGLASGLAGCTSTAEPGATPSPPTTSGQSGGVGTEPAEPPRGAARERPAADAALPEQHDHPTEGDLLVFAFGDREGQVIAPSDVPLGGPQIFAYPADAGGGHVASESRLDQVMLVRMDPASLTEETAARAADGIVAYSAVCTHEGCDVSDWNGDGLHLVCPCHDSAFDPSDNGQVTEGPARRRLAALPLRIVDGALTAGGGFVGRVGFRRR